MQMKRQQEVAVTILTIDRKIIVKRKRMSAGTYAHSYTHAHTFTHTHIYK